MTHVRDRGRNGAKAEVEAKDKSESGTKSEVSTDGVLPAASETMIQSVPFGTRSTVMEFGQSSTPEIFGELEHPLHLGTKPESEIWQIGNLVEDRYKVRGVLGRGGMGIVYYVYDTTQNLELAMKTPLINERKAELVTALEERFIREALAWVGLGLHPHIVTCYYVRRVFGRVRLFIEYVSGQSLDKRLNKLKTLPSVEVLDIAIQLCWGLTYVHKRGLIHRDIKPANILLTGDSSTLVAKLTDFGVVLTGKDENTTVDGREASPLNHSANDTNLKTGVIGTPPYMAPELFFGAPANAASDIYALGVTLYEALTGCWPIGEENHKGDARAQMALFRQTHKQNGRPNLNNAGIPEPLRAILGQCLTREPQARPTAIALAKMLCNAYTALTRINFNRETPIEIQSTADGLNNKAFSLYELGRKEQAEALWHEALQVDPLHLAATYNYNYWRWRTGQIIGYVWEMQMRALENTHHGDADYWRYIAWFHLERGEEKKVENLRQKAITGNLPALGIEFETAWQNQNRPLWHEVAQLEGHTNSVQAVCFSPDGRWALSGSSDKTLRLWDVAKTIECGKGQEVARLEGHTESVQTVSFSPDGRWILSGSIDKTLRLWDVAKTIESGKGQEVASHKETKTVSSVCFSPDGCCALSSVSDWSLNIYKDNDLRLWNIAATLKSGQWEEVARLEGHKEPVESIYFSPDGQWALSGGGCTSGWRDYSIRLWDIAATLKTGKGQAVAWLTGHTGSVRSVCFSPDGRWAFSASWDKTLRLWDISTTVESGKGQEVAKLEGMAPICFSPDGHWALSNDGGDWGIPLLLWDIAATLKDGRGHEVARLEGHSGYVNSICFSPDGRWALSGSADKTLRLWEICFRSGTDNWRRGHPFPVLNQCLHITYDKTGEILRQASELLKKTQVEIERENFAEAYQSLCKRKQLAGYEHDRIGQIELAKCTHQARRVSLQSAWNVAVIECHSKVGSVCFSDEGHWAISGGGKYTIDPKESILQIWDMLATLQDGQGYEVAQLEGHNLFVKSICFSPDGQWALSGSNDNTVRLWDMSATLKNGKGVEVARLEGHTADVRSVCFSPDGRWILSGGLGGIHEKYPLVLWDVAATLKEGKGQAVVGLERDDGSSGASVCFSPDGRWALSAVSNDDGYYVRIWDMAATLKDGKWREVARLEGHTSFIQSICFSPDGRWILSGSYDQTLRLWDMAATLKDGKGREVARLEGHTGIVESVCFSPDGLWALSGSRDKTVRLWDVATAVKDGKGREVARLEGHTNDVFSVCFSPDGCWVLSGSFDKTVRVWALNWELEFPELTDWDASAYPYLQNFLTLHTTYASQLPTDQVPPKEENTLALIQYGKPAWDEADFKKLLYTLRCAGFGWLREQGVRTELEKWTGSPTLSLQSKLRQRVRQWWHRFSQD